MPRDHKEESLAAPLPAASGLLQPGWEGGAAANGVVPGVSVGAAPNTLGLPGTAIIYCPIYVAYRTTYDRISSYVTAGAGVGNLARFGICTADISYLPSRLLLDAGTVSVEFAGNLAAIDVTFTLAPGRYLMMLGTAAAAPTCKVAVCSTMNLLGVSVTNAMSPRTLFYYQNAGYVVGNAFVDPPPQPTNYFVAGVGGFSYYPIFLRPSAIV